MSIIYENALMVLIWPGVPGDPDSVNSLASDGFGPRELGNAMELVSAFSIDQHLDYLPCFELSHENRPQPKEKFSPGFEFLCRLMKMSWWTRIWTVQEIVLSRQATFLLGSSSINWSDLETAALNIRKHRSTCCRGLFGTLTPKRYDKIGLFYLPIHDIARYRGILLPRPEADLILILNRFRNRLAWDSRDKIYGLLGLLPLVHRVEIEYHRGFASVYIDLMMRIIAEENNLRVLVDFKPERMQHGDLPSWVIDWRTPVDSSRLRIQLFRYDKYRSFLGPPAAVLVNRLLLQVSGTRIDQIAVLQPAEKFPKGSYVYLFLEKIEKLMASNSRNDSPYISGGTIEGALWRTLLGNLVWEAANSQYRLVAEEEYALYQAFHLAKRAWTREDTFLDITNTVEQSLYDRAFFITTEGYIGIGPPAMRVGDDVLLVQGSNVPFVLRSKNESVVCEDAQNVKVQSRVYSFIGDCYVHGLMEGEVMYESGRELNPVAFI